MACLDTPQFAARRNRSQSRRCLDGNRPGDFRNRKTDTGIIASWSRHGRTRTGPISTPWCKRTSAAGDAINENIATNGKLGVFTGDALFIGEAGRTDLPEPERTGETAGLLYDMKQHNLWRYARQLRCGILEHGFIAQAALIHLDGRIHALASEGRHADLGPFNEEQWQLLRYTQRQYQRVSYEVLLGGQGLVQIYHFLRDSGADVTPPWLEEEMRRGDMAACISRAALHDKCQLCVRALDMFVSILAAEVGNAAVKFLATGGVYLGGGIPPQILERLREPIFLENLVNKDKMRHFLQSIPVHVILNPAAALQGAAWYARRAASVLRS